MTRFVLNIDTLRVNLPPRNKPGIGVINQSIEASSSRRIPGPKWRRRDQQTKRGPGAAVVSIEVR